MGIERIALGAVALLAFQFCGSDEEAETDVPAIEGTEAVAFVAPGELPAPLHGGTVVAAGEHPIEVVAHEDGNVHAFVLSPEPPPPSNTQMTVHVTGDDGARHPVLLVWDPGEARYRGQLRRVHPAPGPVEVVLVSDGHTYRGSQPTFVVIGPTAPALELEGPTRPTVVVERPSPTVVVERRSPTIVVERPSPTIVVERPAPHVVVHHPRPHVVVEAPRPGVVVHHGGPRVHHVGHGPPGHVRVRGHGPGRGHHHGHGGPGRVRVRAR